MWALLARTDDADAVVSEALLDDVVTPTLWTTPSPRRMEPAQRDSDTGQQECVATELERIEQECARVRSAIGAAGELDELVEGLGKRERGLASPTGTALALEAEIALTWEVAA